MALSQQAHLGQVGWGCKPRDEGGKEGEGPCVPVQCQRAQGLCFMLLSVLGQLTAGKGGCVAGAWASECLMGRPPRKEKVPLPPCSAELFGVIAHTV